jgi:hypothetical protein
MIGAALLAAITLVPVAALDEQWPPHHVIDEQVAVEALQACRQTWHDGPSWYARAEVIRSHLISTLGFDPSVGRPPVAARVSAPQQRLGYTISNVLLETAPGLYIAGNLYLPDRELPEGGRSIVLCPHGHFRGSGDNPEGRFQHNYQRLCGELAQRGAIVMTWDMVGWGESTWLAHNDPRTTVIQTWNSMRVLDWLLQRGDVDPTRIGVTGSSGGGTQTFLLTAVDGRIDVSVPVVMVSAHFFGGCVCESGLPIHHGPDHRTNNVEIAALAAPRPMAVISCGGDWTANTPTVEFPYIQDVYRACGAAEACANVHLKNEGHDYGPSKQAAAIAYLAEHLSLPQSRRGDGPEGAAGEFEIAVLERMELLAVTGAMPLPENALTTHALAIKAIRSVVPTGKGR